MCASRCMLVSIYIKVGDLSDEKTKTRFQSYRLTQQTDRIIRQALSTLTLSGRCIYWKENSVGKCLWKSREYVEVHAR